MKIGFVSMPFIGHLNPMTALGRKLQSRGHEIVIIGVPDVEPFARVADLTFVPFCEEEYPAGSIAELYAPISKLYGLEAARQSVRDKNAGLFTAASQHLPWKLTQTGVEALVIDVIHTYLELVPLSLQMPYAQVSTGLPLDLSASTPPFFFSWPHGAQKDPLAQRYGGHGWPLSADDWDAQMLFFLSKGYRVIAYDRRGHGRSTQTGDGHA